MATQPNINDETRVMPSLSVDEGVAPATPETVTAKKSDPDDMSLRVLVDGDGERIARKVYKSYIHEEKFARFPAFLYAFDQLLVEFGAQPPADEDDENDPDADDSEDADVDEDSEEVDDDEPRDIDYSEEASLHENPSVQKLTDNIRQGLVTASAIVKKIPRKPKA